MVRKGLGPKRFDQKSGPQKAVWAKSGAGQKWCGPQVVIVVVVCCGVLLCVVVGVGLFVVC